MPRAVVVGQGYVGLPLAIAAARAGHHVAGIDTDPDRVAVISAAQQSVFGVAADDIAAEVEAGRYAVSGEFTAVADADVVVVCVPTPYDHDAPDLSHVEDAALRIGGLLTRGTLVILQSTTYPGATEEVLVPILERSSGLDCRSDVLVAYSPERIDPGNPTYGLKNTPKLVGGLTTAATDAAVAFYGSFIDDVLAVSSPKVAELAKLLENTFRHINIALVNELAVLAGDLGVDVWEVISAAASKPFGFMPFYPGPGVGGHCIPVDPLHFSWRVKQFGGSARFVDLARDVNAGMPAYVVSRVQDLLNDRGCALKGSRVHVLGVAYKPDISDTRESPGLAVIDLLQRKGAEVSYSDPHVPEVRLQSGGTLVARDPADGVVVEADCVILVTPHSTVDHDAIAGQARLLFDTRNAVGLRAEHVYRL